MDKPEKPIGATTPRTDALTREEIEQWRRLQATIRIAMEADARKGIQPQSSERRNWTPY